MKSLLCLFLAFAVANAKYVDQDTTTFRVKRAEQLCEPGSRFKEDCNNCVCSADGSNKACTRKSCLPAGFFNEDGIPRQPATREVGLLRLRRSAQSCQPGTTIKKDCNTCTCLNDGVNMACTLKGCSIFPPNNHYLRSKRSPEDADYTKQICEPGAKLNVDCNKCTCSNDGIHMTCTMMACLPHNFYNEDGSLKDPTEVLGNLAPRKSRSTHEEVARHTGNDPAPKTRVCEPGRSFKKSCNTCFCNADGTAMGCTLMLCSGDLDNVKIVE